MLSALMPAHDGGLIVRVYQAAGKPADAIKLHFTAPVASVSEVDEPDGGSPGIGGVGEQLHWIFSSTF